MRSWTFHLLVSHGFRRRQTRTGLLQQAEDWSARGRQIRNESIEIEIDTATGGIRSLAAVGESTARLGQQLVMTGLLDAQGKPATSKMQADRFELDYGGPALVQATSSGSLIDPQKDTRLASFTQRFRLWAGRPVLEIDITLSDLDTAWLERAAEADPWSVYLACRWAWPDPSSMLRRGVFWSPEITDIERPETPEYFDISTRSQRTAILFERTSLPSQTWKPDARYAVDCRSGINSLILVRSCAGP